MSLDKIYCQYNRREFVHPDPIEFLYDYTDIADREIVGFVASSLAYGRVAQILKSVELVIRQMEGKPREFILENDGKELNRAFRGFKHRFTTGSDIASLLTGVKAAIKKHGSLNKCFLHKTKSGDRPLLKETAGSVPFISGFVNEISGSGKIRKGFLPTPFTGSACKRINLYLRWMVRKDDVDPGGWKGINPAALIVPLDTHMFKIGRALSFTKRTAADIKAAMEITEGFAAHCPEDPVKYDFALTRYGIRREMSIEKLLAKFSTIR